MSRLEARFARLSEQNSKALLAYIVAGDPVPSMTVDLMHDLVRAGVNAIELGVPFSDPEAEGPVIQLAHERALSHGVSLTDCLDMVAQFRVKDQVTPVLLMGYLNPIEAMGHEDFARRASVAGVDGVIIVNLPPEEAGDLHSTLTASAIDLVYLLAPTTTDERAALICSASSGFVYYVSLKGTTGAANIDVNDVAEKLNRFRALSTLPVMVGFGISNGETAARVANFSDGVAVGSAIVNLMGIHQKDYAEMSRSITRLVSEIRQTLDAC